MSSLRALSLTVAVSVCTCGVPAQGPGFEKQVNDALARSRPFLMQALARSLGGELALVCLAAVHDDVPPDDPVFVDAIARLEAQPLGGTYGLALRLMVMADLETYPDRADAARRDTRALLRNQARKGGFGYGQGRSNWDMSNTQYGALGMRAAVALGADVPQSAWRNLLLAAETAQTRRGGFGYQAGSSNAGTMSMTVAGIAVLELCLQYVQDKKVPAGRIAKRLRAAWKWMEDHAESIGRDQGFHTYYAHYGLERASILSGRSHVGEVDWYHRGAAMMLAEQKNDGRWSRFPMPASSPRVHDAQTQAFAVLFLRRKFRRALTPVTLGSGLLTRGLPVDATAEQVARAVELDVARGLRAVPDLLKAMRSDNVARRKAAALALRAIAGEDFGYYPYRDPAKSGEAIKSAERWWMANRGSLDDG